MFASCRLVAHAAADRLSDREGAGCARPSGAVVAETLRM